MCFGPDSRPPIEPMAGASIDHESVVLEASDGNRVAGFIARAHDPSGVGMLVLPDVRGLFGYYEELALRFAEIGIDAVAIDYYGRTAGASRRDASFEFASHVPRTTWAGLQADVRAAAAHLRQHSDRIERLFSIGFCFGGRLSFLLSSLSDLDLAGVIGFYGWPVGPSKNDTPAPVDLVERFHAPVLGIFGGADPKIGQSDVSTFEDALRGAHVPSRIVTYPDAPHSFFDRQQEAFGAASEAAWDEVRTFVSRA